MHDLRSGSWRALGFLKVMKLRFLSLDARKLIMTETGDAQNPSDPNTSVTDPDLQFDTWEDLLFHFYGEGPYYSWHFEDLIRAGFIPRSDQ